MILISLMGSFYTTCLENERNQTLYGGVTFGADDFTVNTDILNLLIFFTIRVYTIFAAKVK